MAFATITSPKNERIKAAIKLRRRKHRGRQGRTIIDGARELHRALDTGITVIEIYFCPELCKADESRRLLERLDELKMQIFEVTPEVFEKMAFGERADGMIGVALPPDLTLDDITLDDNPLVAVVEGLEKPGNLGAIVRSADAAGVSAVIAADQQTDLFNPNAIRSSLGTVFSMQICASPSAEVLDWLRRHKMTFYAARVDAPQLYTEVDLTGPTALVLGAESSGLSGAWAAGDITPIRLPMSGVADSLNVSATAAVLFYEAQRQRSLVGVESSRR